MKEREKHELPTTLFLINFSVINKAAQRLRGCVPTPQLLNSRYRFRTHKFSFRIEALVGELRASLESEEGVRKRVALKIMVVTT